MSFMLPAIQTYHLLHHSLLFSNTFSIHLSYCFLTCIYPFCDACIEFYHFVSVFNKYSRCLFASSAATAINSNGLVHLAVDHPCKKKALYRTAIHTLKHLHQDSQWNAFVDLEEPFRMPPTTFSITSMAPVP